MDKPTFSSIPVTQHWYRNVQLCKADLRNGIKPLLIPPRQACACRNTIFSLHVCVYFALKSSWSLGVADFSCFCYEVKLLEIYNVVHTLLIQSLRLSYSHNVRMQIDRHILLHVSKVRRTALSLPLYANIDNERHISTLARLFCGQFCYWQDLCEINYTR